MCLNQTLGHGCRLCLAPGFAWPGSVGLTTGCSPTGMTGVSPHTVTVKWPAGFGTAAPEETLIYRPSDMHISQGKAFRVHLPCLWRGFTNASGSAEAFPPMPQLSQQTLPALLLIQQRKNGTMQHGFLHCSFVSANLSACWVKNPHADILKPSMRRFVILVIRK